MVWLTLFEFAALYGMYVVAKEVFLETADQRTELSELQAQECGLNAVIEQQRRRLSLLKQGEL
ncbi:hypothetical protein [Aeoliella sp.]|uniref:hypothetical protein n=1 Tax=Aeoliella sp. TaxID=2795800 RepID=UPI003CCBAE35